MISPFRCKSFATTTISVLALLMTSFLLVGCDLAQNKLKHDRAANMNVQDFREALAPRVDGTTETADASGGFAGMGDSSDIPALEPYIVPPSEFLKPMPLVSISVNQTVPLRDVLFELAEQADYDIELDPRIKGSIIFTARNRPFDVVVQRISDIAGLRYKFEDDRLLVELDRAYQKNYKIDYLSYIRTNSGSIRNDVSVVSGDGTNTGSAFEVTTSSESDFWGELRENMAQLLGVPMATLRTDVDPVITAAPTQAAPVEPVMVQDGSGTTQVQPPQATLQVQSLPIDAANGAGSSQEVLAESTFALNRQAGIISVFATERQHKQVKEYLDLLKRSVSSQVLIEAKVLEVSLKDEFASGIDWSAITPWGSRVDFGFDSPGKPAFSPETAASEAFLTYVSGDFTAAIDAISRFGTVRALASPRMTVLNNQSALLNVANNQVYFELDIDVTTDEGVTQTEIDSEIRNVPEGVLINVQPSIDLDNKTISMAVRPTITRITDRVSDPAIAFIAEDSGIDVSSDVPVLNVQELDSVIKVNSGQAIVMGGLMQDRSQATEEGVPVLSEVPVFGYLFKTHVDNIEKTELVIFLRATIIDSGEDTISDIDRDLYKRFSGDRRPLKL